MDLSLAHCKRGDRVKILKFNVGYNAQLNLINMGLVPEAEVVIGRKSPFSGPLILCVAGTEIALGKRLAEKILVEKI